MQIDVDYFQHTQATHGLDSRRHITHLDIVQNLDLLLQAVVELLPGSVLVRGDPGPHDAHRGGNHDGGDVAGESWPRGTGGADIKVACKSAHLVLDNRTYTVAQQSSDMCLDLPSLQLDASHRRSRGSRQATR